MSAPKSKSETFEILVARAKRAGLLKFCADGIAVLRLDPEPAPAASPAPPAPTPEQASNNKVRQAP